MSGCGATPEQAPTPTPQAVADELLAADRAFSVASARTDVVSGLTAMFAEDVTLPAPPGRFYDGAPAATEALRGNADLAAGRAEWTPIRAGVSADGQHGFTYGYMTQQRPDSSSVPLKYLAYWVKGPAGWRVVGYRRRLRPAGEVSLDLLPPALPETIVPATTDTGVIASHRQSLDSVERAFSDEAQRIGLGPAFVKFGSPDAMNMGGPEQPGFVFGSDSIGALVASGGPATGSAVSWGPDHRVVVASSGDLGITFGMIRFNTPGADGTVRPPIPFFTIWRRAGPGAPWRYVAE